MAERYVLLVDSECIEDVVRVKERFREWLDGTDPVLAFGKGVRVVPVATTTAPRPEGLVPGIVGWSGTGDSVADDAHVVEKGV